MKTVTTLLPTATGTDCLVGFFAASIDGERDLCITFDELFDVRDCEGGVVRVEVGRTPFSTSLSIRLV